MDISRTVSKSIEEPECGQNISNQFSYVKINKKAKLVIPNFATKYYKIMQKPILWDKISREEKQPGLMNQLLML
jgi:hypothetical protein